MWWTQNFSVTMLGYLQCMFKKKLNYLKNPWKIMETFIVPLEIFLLLKVKKFNICGATKTNFTRRKKCNASFMYLTKPYSLLATNQNQTLFLSIHWYLMPNKQLTNLTCSGVFWGILGLVIFVCTSLCLVHTATSMGNNYCARLVRGH